MRAVAATVSGGPSGHWLHQLQHLAGRVRPGAQHVVVPPPAAPLPRRDCGVRRGFRLDWRARRRRGLLARGAVGDHADHADQQLGRRRCCHGDGRLPVAQAHCDVPAGRATCQWQQPGDSRRFPEMPAPGACFPADRRGRPPVDSNRGAVFPVEARSALRSALPAPPWAALGCRELVQVQVRARQRRRQRQRQRQHQLQQQRRQRQRRRQRSAPDPRCADPRCSATSRRAALLHRLCAIAARSPRRSTLVAHPRRTETFRHTDGRAARAGVRMAVGARIGFNHFNQVKWQLLLKIW